MALLLLSVFCFDIYDFFSTDPPLNSSIPLVYHHSNESENRRLFKTGKAARMDQLANLNRTYHNTILIKFSSQCSYRGTATSIKLMVIQNFPGINVTLSHHPPIDQNTLLQNSYQLHKF